MSNKLPAYAVLILPVPVDRMFTYYIPEEIRHEAAPGKRAIVQFGSRKFYTAMIYELVDSVAEDITPKPIDMILDDHPVVSLINLKFWKWMSEYYLCSPGDVMKTALPAGLRIESETKIELHSDFQEEMTEQLQQHEQLIVASLKEKDNLTVTEIQKLLGIKHVVHLVKNLISKGIAVSYEDYTEKYIPKTEKWIRLGSEYEENEELLLELSNTLSRKAPKQSDVLILFIHETTIHGDTGEMPKKDLTARCSQQAIQALLKKGVLEEYEKIVSRFPNSSDNNPKGIFTLSSDQQEVMDSILTSFKTHDVHLLHGITSSGKTEIYIRLMEEELKAGRQVLYMLPEIALTTQIIERLRSIFGNKVGVYHHRFNYNEKIELWNSVSTAVEEDSKYQIIVGTRSAMFLPFSSPGLIIIDEEHDSSYKQTDISPRYNARDAAIVMGSMMKCKVLLGTATPSIESYYNAVNNRYGFSELFTRYGDTPLPEVKIVDMTKEGKEKQGAWYISHALRKAMKETLEKKKQIILFQNRRGFVPIVQCTQCGWIPDCKHCDITLTYHKKMDHLKCHLCGYTNRIPERCPVCGNTHIKFSGYGTEKVEEEIKALFPNSVVGRLDADTTRGKYSHQQIISAFENGETDIMVGTQMVSKGLDFERVNLVGILNADNLMHFPDFRSFERGYQVLTQIMGRAGRRDEKGLVILQTRKPTHNVIQFSVQGNYLTFYEEQIKERHMFRYPPFYRLIMLSVQHKIIHKANSSAAELKKRISKIEGLVILGPEEPVYGRVKQYFIRNIMIKIPRTQKHAISRLKIRETVSMFLAEKEQSGLRIITDADPA